MKVLMISFDRSIGGADSPAHQRIRRYGAAIDELHIIIPVPRGAPSVNGFIGNHIWIYPTRHSALLCYFFAAFRIGQRVCAERNLRPDDSLITTQDIFPTGIVGSALKKITRLPLQIQMHSDVFSPYFWRESFVNALTRLIASFILSRADAIRVVSRRICDSLVTRGISSARIVVIPIFTNVRAIIDYAPRFNLHRRYPSFRSIILVMARLVPTKNIALAVRAMKYVIQKNLDIGLVIVGTGPEEKNLRALAHPFSRAIVFEKWTDDPISYYTTADIFLFTSYHEGWGIALVEAMAAGLPVITTPVGCASELIKDGENGYIVPFDNDQALAGKIVTLYKNSTLQGRFGHAARETVKQLAPRTVKEYTSLIITSWQKTNGLKKYG